MKIESIQNFNSVGPLVHEILTSKVKVKVIPLQAIKVHGDVDARVHINTATALRRGRVVSPTLGCLRPQGKPRYSFYRRLSGPLGQFEHEGMKKNLHSSDTRDRTRAVQPVVKRVAP